jgi:hypothetical protein
MPGRGALQASGMPAALIALTVKKTTTRRSDHRHEGDEIEVELEAAEEAADPTALQEPREDQPNAKRPKNPRRPKTET